MECLNAAGKAAGDTGGFVEYPLRLAMLLRWMAGASYLDLCVIFGVATTSFYPLVWSTLEAIDAALPDLSLEDDVESLARCRKLATRFAEKTEGRIKGCIGALDGMSLKIEQPRGAHNPLSYFCRKLFNAVSLQAICDADRRFLFMSMSQAGSTHDSYAWNVARTRDGGDRIGMRLAASQILKRGCDSLAPWGFFLVADDAYRCCQTVVGPWSGARAARSPCERGVRRAAWPSGPVPTPSPPIPQRPGSAPSKLGSGRTRSTTNKAGPA